MRTAITKDQTRGQQSILTNLSIADRLMLIGAVVLLISFLVLPWLSEAGASATGINLLTSSSLPFSQPVQDSVRSGTLTLLLIPAAGILAIAAVFWGVLVPRRKRIVPTLTRAAGMIALVYYIAFFIEDRATTAPMISLSGGGFWIAFFTAIAMALQFMIPRTASEVTAAQEGISGNLTKYLTRYTGSLTRDPRIIRAINFAFRFQSFFGLIIVFVLAVMFSPIRNDANIFLSQRNLSNVTRDVAETGILAVGQLLVIIVGGIDLSVGSVVALTATGVAFLLMRDLMPAIPAILIILGLGSLIGWWNGWTAERFKIPSFVTTLAMLSIARGVAHIWSSDIAVPLSYGAGGADPLFEVIGERINGVFPVPALIMFGAAIVMGLILQYTAFGRHIYAIGGNQVAARLSGVAVSRLKITAFILCGFFASMAGILHAAQLNQGSPNEAVGYELNAIAAVVIGGASLAGGKGTIAGAIAGAFILGILDNMLSLNNVNSNAQLVTKGLLVVAAVALQQLRPHDVE